METNDDKKSNEKQVKEKSLKKDLIPKDDKIIFKEIHESTAAILIRIIRFKHLEKIDYREEMDLFFQTISNRDWFEIKKKEEIVSLILNIAENPELLPYYEFSELPNMPVADRKIALVTCLNNYFAVWFQRLEDTPELLNIDAVNRLTKGLKNSNGKLKTSEETKDLVKLYNGLFPRDKATALQDLYKNVVLSFRLEEEIDKKMKLTTIAGILAMGIGLIDKEKIEKHKETSKQDILNRIRDVMRAADRALFDDEIIEKDELFNEY